MDLKSITARKIINFTDRTIDRILTVLFLIVLAIGAYFTYDSWYVFNHSNLDRLPGYEWNGPETLAELPKEAIAWIEIDDTKINCPIMQGETNNEYLNKNPYGEYSLAGSIFLDYRNAYDFSDSYSVLYGHHMSGGYMFGILDEYLKEDFFDSHRSGTLTIKDDKLTTDTQLKGKEYKIDIFAVVETDAAEGTVFNVPPTGDVMKFIRDNATVFREPKGDRILALSTCKSPLTTDRIVVFGILMDLKCYYHKNELQSTIE